jgi:hypothetical protein
MPLILVIAIAWIAVVTLVVALCLAAGRADAAMVHSRADTGGRSFLPGVIVWRDMPELVAEDTRSERTERALSAAASR